MTKTVPPRAPAYMERVREGRARRGVQRDGPGLLTVARIKRLYVAGAICAGRLERSLEIALRRECR